MDYVVALMFIVFGFALLVKGADLFVDHASGIARKIGIPPLVVGLTIVAFGTSMPELAVSVTAALEGHNEIAVVNVVGSNIFNLLVVAGASACFFPLVTNRTILYRDWPISTVMALVLAVFLWPDMHISRGEAAVLFLVFVAILLFQIRAGKKEGGNGEEEEKRSMIRLLTFLIIGIAAIIIGAQLSVNGATSIARLLGVSESLIGLTIVAVGTSLPELVTSVVAARKGENEIALGNVIGSNIFNICCILGISAFLRPITVEATAMFDTLFLAAISLVFWIMCRWKKLDWKLGSVMVLTYVGYMVYIILR